MSEENSVALLVRQIEEGNPDAARDIWERFIHRLIGLARKRLRDLPRRAVDEEDVAISAFNAFFEGVADRRFERLGNGEDLWQVLAMLTERKAIAVMRRELADKRGGGLNRGESVFNTLIAESSGAAGIQAVADPSPEVVEQFTLGVREMLEALSDEVQQKIAALRLEGFASREIAAQLGISLRAVERKFRLIRNRWEELYSR